MSARLASVPGLQVVTPRATNEFSAGEKDLERVARATGATLVLGGAIQRAGDQLRITCSLVRAPDGVHLGGEEVTTRASDIFGAQDRLAESVLSWLGARSGARSRGRPARTGSASSTHPRRETRGGCHDRARCRNDRASARTSTHRARPTGRRGERIARSPPAKPRGRSTTVSRRCTRLSDRCSR